MAGAAVTPLPPQVSYEVLVPAATAQELHLAAILGWTVEFLQVLLLLLLLMLVLVLVIVVLVLVTVVLVLVTVVLVAVTPPGLLPGGR